MPTGTFSVSPITANQWRRSIKRFRQRATRGCDGCDRCDLLAMSDSQVSTLLSLLHSVEENEDTGWPVQLLEEFVLSLAKVEAPHLAAHYRPIVLPSIIYRCWASLRSRQLLRWLAQLVPEDAYGFIPGREPAQVWLLLQAQIEATKESQHSLCGLSSDLVRAFNNIRRAPLFELAAHLGIPSRLTSPWKKFLSTFRRRFSVHGQLSDAYTSNTGIPEGCPLSVAAMAVLNWSMRAYLARFNPESRLRSFCENLTITATAARQVAGAFCTLRTYLRLGGYNSMNRRPTPGAPPLPLGVKSGSFDFPSFRTLESWVAQSAAACRNATGSSYNAGLGLNPTGGAFGALGPPWPVNLALAALSSVTVIFRSCALKQSGPSKSSTVGLTHCFGFLCRALPADPGY